MFSFLSKWPLVRQICERKDGTGPESMSERTRAMHARIDDAKVARSICPYCGVGCGQLIYHKEGKLISIEGDPESPISQGNLCPKGAASYQLLTHSQRETKIKYRAPRAKQWTEISMDRAMDMVADRVWESRKRTFVSQENGATINHTIHRNFRPLFRARRAIFYFRFALRMRQQLIRRRTLWAKIPLADGTFRVAFD